MFEGLKHVRTLTRGGTVSYQYDREINPKPLRPIAQKLFGKWALVRALHTEADYHRAALEYDQMIARCRALTDTEIVMAYRGPILDPWLSQAMVAVNSMHIPGGKVPTLFIEGESRSRVPGTTPYSTEQAIASWVTHQTRITKPQAIRAKRTKMEHYYAWAKRKGRTSVPFIDPPKGYASKGGLVAGQIADLARDDLTQITSADLQAYKEFLVERYGNNRCIDHLSGVKVLLTQTFDDQKFGPDGRDPGKAVKLPAKREGGKHGQFTDEDVQRIFEALPGQPCHVMWPIKLMAHLGLICEEIADATTHDVEQIDGLVVLHIRADHRVMAGGQKNELKTIQRARSLPLPPDIAEGFWAYVEAVRYGHGKGPLFPGIVPDRDGLRTGKIGRAVRDFIKGLGIEATPYSFRNRFHTQLEGMPDLKPARERYICGHKVEDIHDAYKEHPPHKTYPFIARFNPVGR
jgi:hypothetical protein